MGSVLEPDSPDNNEPTKPIITPLVNGLNELPMEKQFTHMMFCQQIQNVDLETAKQLLSDLHMLYLSQQAIMVKIAKQEFLGGI